MDEEKLIDMLARQDEITWQSIIWELIKSEQMDPWDINVSLLSQKYIEMIKKIKETDLRISGKVVLAAALLLKIKSNRLVGEDLDKLDSMFAYLDEPDCDLDFFSEFCGITGVDSRHKHKQEFKLLPRTPQPRKRKVSIYDLMNALQKAMDVKKRRVMRDLPDHVRAFLPPQKHKDVSLVIREVLSRIKLFFFNDKQKSLTFTQLLPDEPSKEDKVYTFIPLLHLTTQRKIDMDQKEHFGEISIRMAANAPVEQPAAAPTE
ncbi:MAG: ScpA family protein [Candidatus Woesearchaeota archaeon]